MCSIFYWPFQGGTSFVDLLCFCSVLCLLCLCARLFICALWSPAGKGLTSWLSFVVSAVSLSLSHWYPGSGSGVVLDCIDSWSLHPYILSNNYLNLQSNYHKIPFLGILWYLFWYACWETTDLLAILCLMIYCVFVTLPYGVVFDCIDSLSLSSCLLWYVLLQESVIISSVINN